MGGGVLPGLHCRGSSLGRDGEGVASECLSCDVARKVFCPIFPSGFGQCVCCIFLRNINSQAVWFFLFALIPDSFFQDGSTSGRDSSVAHFVVG